MPNSQHIHDKLHLICNTSHKNKQAKNLPQNNKKKSYVI